LRAGALGFVLLVGLTALWSVVFVGFMQLVASSAATTERRER
jgi:hypothetical protein